MDVQQDKSHTCPLGIDNRRRIQNLVESDDRQWVVIDKIRDRLPTWAVFLVGLLMSVVSACITIIITYKK